MYHNIFIHLFVGEHLGCFLVLTNRNSSAMNIELYVSFKIVVFSGYMTSSGIAVLYGNFIPSFFKDISTLFSIVTVSIYIPTNCARGFPFLHISPAFIVGRYFDDDSSDWHEMTHDCTFDLHFSNNKLC